MAFLENSPLIGTWILESSENTNAYLKELGMSLAKRKTTINVKPSIIISKNGDMWSIEIDMKSKGIQTIFVEGQDTDTSNELKFVFDARFYFDSRRFSRSIFKFESPSKLVQDMKFVDTEERQKITREINNKDELIETLEMNGVQAVRMFKRA